MIQNNVHFLLILKPNTTQYDKSYVNFSNKNTPL